MTASAEGLARWVADSRAGQGLPPKVEDDDAILQAAALLLADQPAEGDGGDGRAA